MGYTLQRMRLIAVVGAIVVGCASNVPMTPEAANAIKNKEVIIARREKPDFMAASPGKGMLGMVGIAWAISAGNDLVAKNNIADPAIYIAEKLSQELAAKYGVKVLSDSVTLTDDNIEAIAKNNPTADLVLEVSTIGWNFLYYVPNAEKYRVGYGARLRLIDAKGGGVLAAGDCSNRSEETPSSPTYEELLANGAERLKKDLRDAADFCVGEFKTKVFQIQQ